MNGKRVVVLVAAFFLLLLSVTAMAQPTEKAELVLTGGTTTRVSIASDRMQGNNNSQSPSISSDGRYVAFHSSASNLVSNDTNGTGDIFVHDRQTGETTRVSVADDGTQGNSYSYFPSISNDGRYVAFVSNASNLVSDDTNDVPDVFVYDQQMGGTTRVSVASNGMQGNGYANSPFISNDGRYVAFYSDASNLVNGDTNGVSDVFVHDRQTGGTVRVSVASDGMQGNSWAELSSISEDGRYIAFHSSASNLVNGDTNSQIDVFVHDQQTGGTTRVSVADDGTQGNSYSIYPSISNDGRYVAFYSDASNLVNGDTNFATDIFVHDQQMGETTRVSVTHEGTQGNNSSYFPSISSDGRYVAFHSFASNLVSDDTNGTTDVFVYDRQTGKTMRMSVATDGAQGNNGSFEISMSDNGRYVAFYSDASNLVSDDTNDYGDIFVHDNLYQPNPDGYSFRNGSADNSWDIFRETFGSEYVDWNPSALLYYTFLYQDTGHGGLCSAMSASSMLFYQGTGWIEPSNFLQTHDAYNTWGLPMPHDNNGDGLWDYGEISDFLVRYQGYQQGQEISNAKRNYNRTFSEMVNDITISIDNQLVNPQYISVRGEYDGECAGHALIPYAYSQVGDTISAFVYDPNHPGDSDQKILFDMNNQDWSYDHHNAIGVWDNTNHCADIKAIPVSLWSSHPTPPWVDPISRTNVAEANDAYHSVMIDGDSQAFLIDSQGRRLGYDLNGNFISEIPNALQVIPDAVIPGVTPTYPEMYQVGTDTPYEINMIYTDVGMATVIDLTPTGTVEIVGNATNSNITDTISINPTMNEVNLIAGSTAGERRVSFISQDTKATIRNFDLGVEKTASISTTTEINSEILEFIAESNSDGYSVTFLQPTAYTIFVSPNIAYTAGDKHIITFDWGNIETATLEIDQDNDGDIDEVVILENVVSKIYLPLIVN